MKSKRLARLADTLDGLRNYNTQVQEGSEEIVFLHRIAPGSGQSLDSRRRDRRAVGA